jgi:hypothetical protein
LWQGSRQRDRHRQRRPRRECFGELVQMDTSLHEWLEGRGESMVLIALIDDATGWVEAGFYPGETVESHFDLFGRWLKKYGRPLALPAGNGGGLRPSVRKRCSLSALARCKRCAVRRRPQSP